MSEKLSQKPKVNSLQDNDIFPITRDNGDSTYSSYGIEASDMQDYFGSGGSTTPVELESDEYICDGTESSVTFDVSKYKNQTIKIMVDGQISGGYASLGIRFNNDNNSNYDWVLDGVNANCNQVYWGGCGKGKTYWRAFDIVGTNNNNTNTGGIITILNYETNRPKFAYSQSLLDFDSDMYSMNGYCLWKKSELITQITLSVSSTFITGTRIKILGEKIKGQAVGGSGETFTTWVLKERKEITSDTDTVEFTGLDGDSDEVYKIVSRMYAGTDTDTPYLLQPNGDSNSANYNITRNYTSTSTNTTVADTSSGVPIGWGNGAIGSLSFGECIIYAKSGQYRTIKSEYVHGTTNNNIHYLIPSAGGLWLNNTTNISSLKIISPVANHIGANSVIELWVQKEVSMPTTPDTPVELENNEYVFDGTENSITIDISSFDGTDLRILTLLKSAYTGTNEADGVLVRFNNDTGTNYGYVDHFAYQSGDGIGSADLNCDAIKVIASTDDTDAGNFSQSIVDIAEFKSNNKYKIAYVQRSTRTPTGGSNRLYVRHGTGIWYNTNPITSITFSTVSGQNFKAGSKIKIYTEKIKGQAVGGSGETFTTWVLKERKEITSDTDTVEFAGLDGDSYNNIKLLGKVKVVKDTELYIQINDDTTATNYRRRLTANGGNITDQGYPGIELGTTSSDELAQFLVDLQSKSGKYRTALVHSSTRITASGISENLTSAHVWYNENDNITKLALKGSESTAIGTGSIIELWVEKEVSMPTAADTPVELENGEYVCDGTEDSITIDVSKFEGEILDIEFYHKRDSNYGTPDNCYIRVNGDTSNSYASNSTSIGNNGDVSNWGSDDSVPVNFLLRTSAELSTDGRSLQLWARLFNYKEADKWTFALGTYTTPYDHAWHYTLAGTYMKNDAVSTINITLDNNAKFTPGDRIRIRTEKIKGQGSNNNDTKKITGAIVKTGGYDTFVFTASNSENLYAPSSFDVLLNTNSCFDPATGVFTAPITGWYNLNLYLSAEASGRKLFNLQINGNTSDYPMEFFDIDVGAHGNFSTSLRKFLNQGETLKFLRNGNFADCENSQQEFIFEGTI